MEERVSKGDGSVMPHFKNVGAAEWGVPKNTCAPVDIGVKNSKTMRTLTVGTEGHKACE